MGGSHPPMAAISRASAGSRARGTERAGRLRRRFGSGQGGERLRRSEPRGSPRRGGASPPTAQCLERCAHGRRLHRKFAFQQRQNPAMTASYRSIRPCLAERRPAKTPVRIRRIGSAGSPGRRVRLLRARIIPARAAVETSPTIIRRRGSPPVDVGRGCGCVAAGSLRRPPADAIPPPIPARRSGDDRGAPGSSVMSYCVENAAIRSGVENAAGRGGLAEGGPVAMGGAPVGARPVVDVPRRATARRAGALADPAARPVRSGSEQIEISAAGSRRVLRVIVDRDGGVDLDSVAELSRAISALLDSGEIMGMIPYILEVSSPGWTGR